MESKKIYLAGPDVFRKNAVEHMKMLKSLCEKYNLIGLNPFDNEINLINFDLKEAMTIFRGNYKLIDQCDYIVANLTPFRGACIDDGTAIEIGYGFKAGKIICGYSEFIHLKLKEVVEWCAPHGNSFGRKEGKIFTGIENFGLTHNLMIIGVIQESGGFIKKTFEEVLQKIKENEI